MMLPGGIEALDLSVMPIFHRMTKRGMAVDLNALEALLEDMTMELEVSTVKIQELAPGLDPSSSEDVSAWMDKEGLTGKRTKKTHRLATDERSLAGHGHPLLTEVLEFRGLQKMISTFIEPTIQMASKYAVEMDGLRLGEIHPRWRTTRVKSGRVSMEDPNLMAFPARTEQGRKVRACFVARPGYMLIGADYSQLEPRVVAALSQDAKLVEIFASGADLYASVADDLHITRPTAKLVTLGVLYGMQAKSLREQLLLVGVDMSIEDCEDLIHQWFDTYTAVRRLVDVTVGRAADSGWAYTDMGRGRYLPALFLTGSGWPNATLREEAQRQAFNHLVQGTAAERVKTAMWDVQFRVLTAYPLLQMHDELIYEVPFLGCDLTADYITSVMESTFNHVKLIAKAHVGNTWSDLK